MADIDGLLAWWGRQDPVELAAACWLIFDELPRNEGDIPLHVGRAFVRMCRELNPDMEKVEKTGLRPTA
ncbi:MAG: hypothetical protein U9R74_14770, partial [Pseudomonadota bacterium]|nr:hypothetical protein [Pseudomonadota bacterium]